MRSLPYFGARTSIEPPGARCTWRATVRCRRRKSMSRTCSPAASPSRRPANAASATKGPVAVVGGRQEQRNLIWRGMDMDASRRRSRGPVTPSLGSCAITRSRTAARSAEPWPRPAPCGRSSWLRPGRRTPRSRMSSVTPTVAPCTGSSVRKELEARSAESVDLLRSVEVARLDALQCGLWDQVMSGDPASCAAMVRIIDQHVRLLGVGTPLAQAGATEQPAVLGPEDRCPGASRPRSSLKAATLGHT